MLAIVKMQSDFALCWTENGHFPKANMERRACEFGDSAWNRFGSTLGGWEERGFGGGKRITGEIGLHLFGGGDRSFDNDYVDCAREGGGIYVRGDGVVYRRDQLAYVLHCGGDGWLDARGARE